MVNLDYLYKSQEESMSLLLNKNYYSSAPLSASVHVSAVILPTKIGLNANLEKTDFGGVNDSLGHFINGTNLQTNTEIGYEYDCKPIDRKEDVVYIGYMHECYGHMITDCISKLWYLQTETYRNKALHLVYISQKPLTKWQLEILELAGVNLSNIERISEITRFNSVIIPDNSQYRDITGEHYYTQAFKETIHLMIESALRREPIGTVKKVYFTRKHWHRKSADQGEDMLLTTLKKKAYKIYAPETLSVSQQIALMQGADEFACLECSASHNAIFMQPGKQHILLRKGLYLNEYSAFILSMCNLDTYVIDCSMSVLNRMGKFAYAGPFFLYPNGNFCRFFHIKKPIFPYCKFKHYYSMAWQNTKLPETLLWEDVYALNMMEEIEDTKMRIQSFFRHWLPLPDGALKNRIINKLIRIIMPRLMW